MGKRDYLKLGSWNVECDRCAEKFKGEELKREWSGFMVCNSCYEPRNAQDFLRGVPDAKPMPYYRPGNDDVVAVHPFDPSTLS